MKHLLVIPFLLLIAFNSHCQSDNPQLDSLKKVWTKSLKKEMKTLGIGTAHREGWSEFSDSISNAYAKDTFLLNGIFSYQMDYDQTTYGMVRAYSDYEDGLDRLLNKYYRILMRKLSKEDQELLRTSQRNWIALRDSERKLSGLLTEDQYSGGGTIQLLIYANWNADYTGNRVQELIDYLERLIE
jgi:uncharacterized protein YecT (DUF1311 family)